MNQVKPRAVRLLWGGAIPSVAEARVPAYRIEVGARRGIPPAVGAQQLAHWPGVLEELEQAQ